MTKKRLSLPSAGRATSLKRSCSSAGRDQLEQLQLARGGDTAEPETEPRYTVRRYCTVLYCVVLYCVLYCTLHRPQADPLHQHGGQPDTSSHQQQPGPRHGQHRQAVQVGIG